MTRRTFALTLTLVFLLGLAAVAPDNTEAQSTMIVDINSAPLADIEAVVRDRDLAQRIIDNRPYANKRQLLSRQLVSMEQYDEIKDRIVARRVAPPNESR